MIEECWPEQKDIVIAKCSVCGTEIYDCDSEAYENEDGDMFCCKECAMEASGIKPVDWMQYAFDKENSYEE